MKFKLHTSIIIFSSIVFSSKKCFGLIFMRNVAIGNLVALAIPLWTNDPYLSNVYMSYNFESNYGASTSATDYTNAYLDKFMLPYDKFNPELDEYRRRPLGGTSKVTRSLQTEKRQQITRKNVYRVIEGYSSKACLLRTICESAITPLAKYNGILGDIFHVLLTPSTSVNEGISEEYYRAEEIGRTRQSCMEFEASCPNNGLDLFTKFF